MLVWRDEASASSAAVEADRVMVGHDEDILSIAYSPPNLLATSGYDGRLLVWNMDSAILKFTLTIPGVERLDVDQRAMWKLTFLEKRTQALVSASADGKLRFWNVKEGCLVWEADTRHVAGGVVALTTEPTNSFLFTGDGAGYLKVWDICNFLNVPGLDQRNNLIELAHWRAHDEEITSLDFIERHHDKIYRLILSSSADTRIKLWSHTAEGVFLAGVLGEQSGPQWTLGDPDSYEPVEQAEPPSATPAADAPPKSELAAWVEEQEAADAADDAARASRGLVREATMPLHNTQDLIGQILAGRSSRRLQKAGTFTHLRTHELVDLAKASPRGKDL